MLRKILIYILKPIKYFVKAILKISPIPKNQKIQIFFFLKNILNILENRQEVYFKVYPIAPFVAISSVKTSLYTKGQRIEFVTTPEIYSLDGALKKYTQPLPDLHLSLIENITVIGGTHLLIKNNLAISDELLLMKKIHDTKAPDIYSFIGKNRLLLTSKNQYPSQINIGLHLLKEHSQNYYHWLSECLPRFILFLQHQAELPEAYQNFKILIDKGLPQQCLEALQLISPTDSLNILTVPRGEKIFCKELIYPAPFWFSLDNTRFLAKPEDFLVDRYGLKLVKDRVEHLVFNNTIQVTPWKKIYLKRVSHYRNLLNQNEIESLLTQKGFEIILAEKLSFIEQVKLFSETKIAIGPSGAVFTNMLFMQPNTLAVIFSPPALKNGFSVFEAHADVAKTHLINLLSYYKHEKVESLHDDFFIDLIQLENLLADQL